MRNLLALPTKIVRQPLGIVPFLVIGALLINAAVLAIWIQSDQTLFNEPTAAQAEIMDRPSAQAGVPDDANTVDYTTPDDDTDKEPNSEVVPAMDNTAQLDEPLTGQKILATAGTTETIEPIEATQISEATESTESSAILVSQVATPQPEPVTTPTGEDTSGWIRIEPDTLSKKAGSGQPLAIAAQNTAVIQRKPISLSDLPYAVRNDLPPVVFSGHLFSSIPDSSVVFVDDGRPIIKGQKISGDLFLREITPTGVIVEFKGYLIDVDVFQDWSLN